MRFTSILKNRLRVLLSDKLFILTMLIVPVILSLITGYAQRKEKLGFIPVILADEDKTEYSALLCKGLDKKEGLKIITGDRKIALEQLEKSSVEAAIIIEEGFQEGLQKGELDGLITLIKSPSTYSAELLKEIVCSQILRIYGGDFTYSWVNESFEVNGVIAAELSREETAALVEEYWNPEPLMTISYEEIRVIAANEGPVSIPPYAAASLGFLVLFIIMSLLFGSGWLCEEKINGTMIRAMSVRGSILPLFLGNTAALCLMGALLTLIFTGVQWLFFGTVLISGTLSLMVILIYILCAASISMFFSIIFKTPHQLQASAPVIALVTGIMGGCLWNFAGVPESLMSLALFTPQGWALRALTNLYAAPDKWGAAISAMIILFCASVLLQAFSYFCLKRALKCTH
ncbi:MAG: ABC transporter permease [Acetivibrionales bacterium]|jgi:ABC-2 type transport system permease protein|nr:ABC transporter permease [Clostridiaceae bacterium]